MILESWKFWTRKKNQKDFGCVAAACVLNVKSIYRKKLAIWQSRSRVRLLRFGSRSRVTSFCLTSLYHCLDHHHHHWTNENFTHHCIFDEFSTIFYVLFPTYSLHRIILNPSQTIRLAGVNLCKFPANEADTKYSVPCMRMAYHCRRVSGYGRYFQSKPVNTTDLLLLFYWMQSTWLI